jgi:acyl-CoA synthetase (NDP forming)
VAASRRPRPDEARVAALLTGRAPGEILLEPESRGILAAWGIPIPPWQLARTAAATVAAAKAVGAPVALKLVARGLAHKSDVGGVLLGVRGARSVAAGHRQLMQAAARAGLGGVGVLVTPMIPAGVEVVVGAFRDVQFGPVVMFGLGGVLVEALDDVVFRVAPLDEGDAQAMIDEVRGRRLFGAFRGRPAIDRASLVDLLVRVSELAAERPEVGELDLNPVILGPERAAVADARIVVG